MKRDIYLSDERYLAALHRIRSQIANNNPLIAENSNVPGDKYNSATWGMCSHNLAQWPDREDHLHERDPEEHQSIKYQKTGQHCPFDSDQDPTTDAFGCFHRCRIFQHFNNLPTREEALTLYDITIGTKS